MFYWIKFSAEQLFQGENPIGKTVEIQKEPFVVVGVVSPAVEFEPTIKNMNDYYTYNQDTSGKVYVPTSVWPLLYQYDEPENVILRAKDTNSMTAIGKQAEEILNATATGNSDTSYKSERSDEASKNKSNSYPKQPIQCCCGLRASPYW